MYRLLNLLGSVAGGAAVMVGAIVVGLVPTTSNVADAAPPVMLTTTDDGSGDTAGPELTQTQADFLDWVMVPENGRVWVETIFADDPQTVRRLRGEQTVPDLIRERFDGRDEQIALDTFWCESKYDTNAISRTNDHGVAQINGAWRSRFAEVTGRPFYDAVYDPVVNLEFAYWLAVEMRGQGGGWSHWTCARNLGYA